MLGNGRTSCPPINHTVSWPIVVHGRRTALTSDWKATMILIVDDDEGFAENCALLLEMHGFSAEVAIDGFAALAKIKDVCPELVISDCQMPKMTGMMLCKILKDNPATAKMPVILMSGGLRCDTIGSADCDGFLKKPFLAEKMLAEVEKLTGGVSTAIQN